MLIVELKYREYFLPSKSLRALNVTVPVELTLVVDICPPESQIDTMMAVEASDRPKKKMPNRWQQEPSKLIKPTIIVTTWCATNSGPSDQRNVSARF